MPDATNVGAESRRRLYFAYGSNMSTRRLEDRLGRVGVAGIGKLPDYEIRFHKLSSDGSGKTDVTPANGNEAWGVVFDLTQAQLNTLSGFEVGYREVELHVVVADQMVKVCTYVAEPETTRPGLRPTREYLNYLIAGAREHQLPADYIRMLEQVVTSD